MKFLIKILIIAAFIRFYTQSAGTEDITACIMNNAEEICLHTNKQVYVSGEVLFYKCYLRSETKESSNSVSGQVYFELINAGNNIVHRWRSSVEEKTAMGQTLLPDTLSGGFYTLVTFTNFQRNFNPELFCHHTIVVTPINSDDFKLVGFNGTPANKKKQRENNFEGLQLVLSDKEIRAGDETRIFLSSPQNSIDKYAEFSVSVNEVSPFDSIISVINGNGESHLLSSDELKPNSDGVFIKESTNYTLSGKVFRKSDQTPLRNTFILASVTDSLINYKYARTDSDGRFYFNFDDYYNDKIIVLQVSHTNLTQADITWQIDSKASGYQVPYTLNKGSETIEQLGYLDKVSRAELVKRVYSEESIGEEPSALVLPPYFPDPGYTVFPADYEALNNFKEIADNILTGVRFTKIDGKYQLAIVDNQTQQVYNVNPMVFLNGQVFQNLEYLQTLSSEDIEKIDVYNTRFFYGNFNINGIVSVYTKNGGVEPSSYHSPYILIQNKTGATERAFILDSISSPPDINPHVCWIPMVSTGKDQKADLSFKAPLVKGRYCVLVKGRTADGKFFKLYETFSVN